MKVDLGIWAKNGAKFLPAVLKRIDEVIPAESVAQKIFVDDASRDESREIAREYNWTIYKNTKGGIAGGSNEVLSHVTREFFVTFEQDLLLARNWWERIPKLMEDGQVAVAQGIKETTFEMQDWLRRLSVDKASSLEEMFELNKVKGSTVVQGVRGSLFIQVATDSGVQVGRFPVSLVDAGYAWGFDNNLFRTRIVRALGGFPSYEPVFVDGLFKKMLWEKTDFRWDIDTGVISDHLKFSVYDYLDSEYRKAMRTSIYLHLDNYTLKQMLRMTITSPFRATYSSIKARYPQFFFWYPGLRAKYLAAYLIRRSAFRGNTDAKS